MRGKKKKTDEEFFQQHTGNASFGSARGTGKGTKTCTEQKQSSMRVG
jgi:hypothetical protein